MYPDGPGDFGEFIYDDLNTLESILLTIECRSKRFQEIGIWRLDVGGLRLPPPPTSLSVFEGLYSRPCIALAPAAIITQVVRFELITILSKSRRNSTLLHVLHKMTVACRNTEVHGTIVPKSELVQEALSGSVNKACPCNLHALCVNLSSS